MILKENQDGREGYTKLQKVIGGNRRKKRFI
jgi:hypothetical protein